MARVILGYFDSPQTIDLSIYRQQAEQALQQEDLEEIINDLQMLKDIASDLLQGKDYLNAGNLYQLLLKQMNKSYDGILREIDYDGDVCCFSQDFVEGLGNCLKSGQEVIDEEQKQDWLLTLFDTYCKEIDLGGIDYGYGAEEEILNYANDRQWQIIASEAEDKINSGSEHNFSSSWRQDTIMRFLNSR